MSADQKQIIQAVRAVFDYVIEHSATLRTYPKLTPRFEVRARKNGKHFDVSFRLFVEFQEFVPLELLPPMLHEIFASLVESNKRTQSFASARRVSPEIQTIEFNDFVYDEFLFQKS